MRGRIVRFTAAFQAMLLMATLIVPALTFGAVSTDQADYAPGSLVTISGDNSNGAGYLAGETIDVVVSGPNGYAASCSATADDSGAWSCQVTLWNTDQAVGAYSYTATGEASGVVETSTFTDATGTTTTIGSSVNPSGLGQSVTFTATVKRNDTNAAMTTGQVKFGSGGNCTGGFTQLQSNQPVSGSGQVTYTTSSLSAGNTTIIACFTAPSGFGDSNASVAQTVDGPPSVASTTPANGTSNVAVSANVVITFNESVTLDADTTIVCTTSGAHTFTQSASPSVTFTLNPTADFVNNEACTVTVTNTSVHDTDTIDPPDNMVSNVVFSFTTPDSAPTVVGTTPGDSATGVAANTNVVITFSESVSADNSGAGWFDIDCTSGNNKAATPSGSPGTVLTLNPTADFASGDVCIVTVTGSKIHDTDTADPPDTMAANYQFTFTVDTAPAVLSTTPTTGATGVGTQANVSVTFNENVNVDAGGFSISCATSGLHPATQTGGPSTFTLDPASDFVAGELCTVTVTGTAIHDQDTGDPPDTMASNYVFTFTVDQVPTVSATTPSNGGVAATNANVVVTFSEPVNVDAGWAAIVCASGSHAYALTGGPTSYTANPTTDFTQGDSCTVTIDRTKVHDQDTGDPPDNLAADYVFSFTVDEAPAVASTTPTNGAVGVATNANIVVNFNESVHFTGTFFTVTCGTSGAHAGVAAPNNSSSITINPTTDFVGGESCTVTILAADVADQDAIDPPDNMASNYVFSFGVLSATQPTSTTNVSGSGTYGSTGSLTAKLTSGATNLSGKSISFSLNGVTVGSALTDVNGVATLSPVSMSGYNAGTVPGEVGASFAGDSGYDASSASGDLVVAQAGQAITFTSTAPGAAVFGDTYAPTATGGGSGNAITFGASGACSYSAPTVTMSGVGSCTVTADQTGNTNYSAAPQVTQVFTVGQAGSTTTVDCTGTPFTYDGGSHACTATATGVGDLNQPLTVVYSGRNATSYGPSATAPTNSGDYTASATYDGDSNHTGSNDSHDFVIAKADASCTVTPYTSATTTYDATEHTASGSCTGVDAGGTAAGSDLDLSNTKHTNAGTYTSDTWSFSGGTNYNDQGPVTITDSIAKADASCIGIVGYSGTYDAGAHGATGDCTGVDAGGTAAGSSLDHGATFTDYPGGTAHWVFTGGTNYNDTSGDVAITINQKEVTGHFTVANKIFDTTTSATILTRTLTGVIGSEVCTLAGGSTAFPSALVGGPYTLTLSGASLSGAACGNYKLALGAITTTASITAWTAAGTGFYQPVGIPGSVFTAAPASAPLVIPSTVLWNTVKGGQTVPLKFNVYAGTVEKTSLADIKSFNQSKLANCSGGVGSDPVDDVADTGGTTLRYDTTAHQWIQNWKTNKVSSTECWRVWVTFADNSTLEAFFQLTK
jgi:methionine-rich copper-binding protein CopC